MKKIKIPVFFIGRLDGRLREMAGIIAQESSEK